MTLIIFLILKGVTVSGTADMTSLAGDADLGAESGSAGRRPPIAHGSKGNIASAV